MTTTTFRDCNHSRTKEETFACIAALDVLLETGIEFIFFNMP